MKKLIFSACIAGMCLATACGSNNQNERDTMDSMDYDTSFMDVDTTGVADTAGRDSMYRNSPARSDGGNSSATDNRP